MKVLFKRQFIQLAPGLVAEMPAAPRVGETIYFNCDYDALFDKDEDCATASPEWRVVKVIHQIEDAGGQYLKGKSNGVIVIIQDIG